MITEGKKIQTKSMLQHKSMSGYLTVFLALSLTIILSLCLTLIQGARTAGVRMLAECVMDIGMNSILAEYHRELLNQYDVLFIDTSYGTEVPSYHETEEHLKNYMEQNVTYDDLFLTQQYADLYEAEIENVNINRVSVATDEKGKVFRQQAVEYMEHKMGIQALKEMEDWMKEIHTNELDQADVTGEREKVEKQIEEIDGSEQQISEEEWVTIEVDNPVAEVNGSRNAGILHLVVEDTSTLSDRTVSLEQCVSHRQKNAGNGSNPDKAREETAADVLLFGEYLLEKCGYYGHPKQKAGLQYQIEYILAGKNSDLDNLKSVIHKILLFREGANVTYLFGDKAKRAEAKALAATASSVLTVPELAVILEYSILFAWAYAESVHDAKILMAGGKIPLIKTTADWYTSIENLLTYQEHLETSNEKTEGLRYVDYLRILLALQTDYGKTMHFLDIVEMDIRQTEGNEHFRIDGCVDSVQATAVVTSGYGGSYSITRRYGY